MNRVDGSIRVLCVARTLVRSFKTIDAHHTAIMKKLDIHDRAELTRYAIREGLVEA